MGGKNIISIKSYSFALRIIKAYQYLGKEHKEFILSKQLLRSGTAIGAMVREAEYVQYKPDFIHKLSIALKEANETEYWLMLLKDSQYITEQSFLSIDTDCKELIKLLVSIIKSSKSDITKKDENVNC